MAPIYICVWALIFMSHGTHVSIFMCLYIHQPIFMCVYIHAPIFMSHGTHVSVRIYSFFTHLHTHGTDAHLHLCHDSFTSVPWLIFICAMTPERLYSCVMAHMCHGAYINFLLIYILMAQILIYICAKTHLHLCHDSWATIFMCYGTHVNQSRVTHCVWVSESLRLLCLNSNRADFLNNWIEREIDAMRHDSFICVTWPIHVCDMTHSYMSFI